MDIGLLGGTVTRRQLLMANSPAALLACKDRARLSDQFHDKHMEAHGLDNFVSGNHHSNWIIVL